MNNPYLSDDHILTSGDAMLVAERANGVYCFVFNLLDAELGGDCAGMIATDCERIIKRRLTQELQVYDPRAMARRRCNEQYLNNLARIAAAKGGA